MVPCFTFIGFDNQVFDVASFCAVVTYQSPCFFGQVGSGNVVEFNGFHHLTNQTVSQNDNGQKILVSDIECFHNHVNSFLYGCGSQNYVVVVAVCATLYCHVIVSLTGLNGTKARATTHHVDDNCGQTCVTDVTDTFLLQCNTGGRRACQHSCACCCCTVNHVNCCYLGFSLHECAAYLG